MERRAAVVAAARFQRPVRPSALSAHLRRRADGREPRRAPSSSFSKKRTPNFLALLKRYVAVELADFIFSFFFGGVIVVMTCWIRSLATDLFGRRQEQQQRSAGAYIKVHSRLAPRLSSSISEIVLFFRFLVTQFSALLPSLPGASKHEWNHKLYFISAFTRIPTVAQTGPLLDNKKSSYRESARDRRRERAYL